MPAWLAFLLLAACAISVVLLLTWAWVGDSVAPMCMDLIGAWVGERTCDAGAGKLLTYVWMLAFFPLMLLLERFIPADPDQPAFSPGLLVDSLWFVTFPLLGVWLPNLFDRLLDGALGSFFANFKSGFLTSLPIWGQLAVVIVLADFLAWFGHLVRHKVPLFWEFHKIHHSQVQLNYFSTRRLHPCDQFAQSLIRFLPWTLLGMTFAVPGFLAWSTILRLYEMFVHSNLRVTLGPLRYILVTPQSHRLHHSMWKEHIDTNFGDFFSVWDWIFRTQAADDKVYPPLGVDDKACPEGMATTLGGGFRTLLLELIYPFKAIGRMLNRA